MSGLLSQLKTVAQMLTELDTPWALIGALAVSVYTEPRTTRDIDVAVALASDDDRQKLLNAFQAKGFGDPTILMHVSPTHKLGYRFQVPSKNGIPVAADLLFSSSGIEREVVEGATLLEVFPNLSIPIASIGHLIAMKVLSQNDSERLNDRVDLQKLFSIAQEVDLNQAREALGLITERGFHRDADLLSSFDTLLSLVQ